MYDNISDIKILPISKNNLDNLSECPICGSNVVIFSPKCNKCGNDLEWREEEISVPEVPIVAKKAAPEKYLKGHTLQIYNYIKNNEGNDINTISQYFSKKTNYISSYLRNMIKYGLIVKDNDKWYLKER